MYPQMLYGNPQRPNQLFGRDGFLRNIPDPAPGEGLAERYALAWNLRRTLNQVKGYIHRFLPDGCPFILGGGFIRDGLMGATISDIDVWLPSNIHHIGVQPYVDFRGEVTSRDFIRQLSFLKGNQRDGTTLPSILFNAPFDVTNRVEDGQAYHDMSNHWVVEDTINNYQFQFMRTNVEWEGDAQSFMTRLMQNFDIMECMFFLCTPADEEIDSGLSSQYVVVPDDVAAFLATDQNVGVWDQLSWNSLRNTTSQERRRARVEKMQRKYIIGDALEFEGTTLVAFPCPVQVIMDNIDKLPLPRLGGVNGGTAREILPAQAEGIAGDPVRQPDGVQTGATTPFDWD